MTLQIPLSFSSGSRSSVHASFAHASPASILAWSAGNTEGESVETLEGPGAVVVGCEDGSLYFFHPTKVTAKVSPSDSVSSPTESQEKAPRPISRSFSPVPRHRRGIISPRSASPASVKSPPPFQVSKSRVVSSVSAELAEAPKNFVDFEDEQEKLKDMIRRKGGVKDKTMYDSLLNSGDNLKSLGSDKCSEASSAHHSHEDLKISTSVTTLSSASSVLSVSTPSTPSAFPVLRLPDSPETCSWTLTSHTVPCSGAPAGPIITLKAVEGQPVVIALSQSGRLSCHSVEDGSCLSALDTSKGGFSPPVGCKGPSKFPAVWAWKSIEVAPLNGSFIVLACASPEATTSTLQHHDSRSGDQGEETRVAAFSLHIPPQDDPGSVELTQVGEWALDGRLEGIALQTLSDGQLFLFHVDSSCHLVKQKLVLLDAPPPPEIEEENFGSNLNLALPNSLKTAFKGLRSSENLAQVEKEEPASQTLLTNTLDLGLLPLSEFLGLRLSVSATKSQALLWSEEEAIVIDVSGQALLNLGSTPVRGIRDIRWNDNGSMILAFSDHAELREISEVDANNDTTPAGEKPHTIQLHPRFSCSFPASPATAIAPDGKVVLTRVKNGRQRLVYADIRPPSDPSERPTRTVWKPKRDDVEKAFNVPRITSILPLELTDIILGYSDGYLARSSLLQLSRSPSKEGHTQFSDVPLAGSITGMHIVHNERTSEVLIVGGSDDGGVAIWSLQTLRLLARWTVFTEPLGDVIYLSSGRLKGCVFCVARDGTIAVVAVDGYQFLFMVPASIAPLERVCLGENNLLLLYSDGRARLWDIQTLEFWRSMNVGKAEEMLLQGGWTQWPIPSPPSPSPSLLSSFSGFDRCPDAASTLILDVEAFLQHLINGNGAKAGEYDQAITNSAKKDNLRSILSVVLTQGVNEEIDKICRENLSIQRSGATVGLVQNGFSTIFANCDSTAAWTISPAASASRASAVIALLQTLAHLDGDAHTVSAFYTASLAHSIGASYKAPNLAFLGKVYLQATVPEVRHAAKLRFEAGIARLLDDQITQLVECWKSHLPSVHTEGDRDDVRSALSLFMCGSVAVEKYTLLHTSWLTEISKSIAIYLHDEKGPHRVLAIELCSRGFPVWQQYVDAVEMLRALFVLATSTRKEHAGQAHVGQHARSAVLHIAASNTPLFMTTISMDILHPKTLQYRKSVLQLVIFLIHKRPLVLYSNLPRLIEAVVKSLDPSSTADRDAVLDSATEILGHVVDNYPTVDFHGPTQRLAVGTSEGAVVMYDLKTATRLYVLEGHKKRTTAVAFSPDGRRLATLSLEESALLVWKVGSSFTSFFNPGAPPRQGRGGSEPFKTYNFNIGEEGVMSIGATLEHVKFEWVNERSVKVKIQAATLTFAT